jgi:hypothetical protein
MHKAEVPQTEAMSVEQIFPDNLTRPVSFGSSSSDIKLPAQAHISGWSFQDFFQ